MKPIIKDLSVVALISLLLLWSFIAAIERLVFFNTNLYPDFLVTKTVSLESKEKMFELMKQSCPQGGADIVKRNNAQYFRCGLLWPTSQVIKIVILNKPSPNEPKIIKSDLRDAK